MRKVAVLIIVLLGMISSFILQGCAIDKPFVYSGDDLKKIDFIKVVRQETPTFRLKTSEISDSSFAVGLIAGAIMQIVYTEVSIRSGGNEIKRQLSIPDFGEIVMKKFTQNVRKEIPQWPMMVIENKPVKASASSDFPTAEVTAKVIGIGGIGYDAVQHRAVSATPVAEESSSITKGGVLLDFSVAIWGMDYAGKVTRGIAEGFLSIAKVRMVDNKGEVLWEKEFIYKSQEFGRGRELEEFKADNGKLLKEEIEFAAEKTASAFIEHLINEKANEPGKEKPALTQSAQAASISQPAFLKSWGKKGGEPGELNSPERMALGPDGMIYVADTNNHRIQVFDSEGSLVKSWGQYGNLDGEMKKPHAVAVGSDGAVYVSDNGNRRILKFDKSGHQIAKLGDKKTVSSNITGIAVDAKGNIYTVDTDKHRIVVYDQKGESIKTIGKKGIGKGAMMEDPADIAIDQFGNIYVVDASNKRIQKFEATGNVSAVIGFETKLDDPTGLGLDKNGNIYLADKGLRQIFVYNSTGRLIARWGNRKSENENERFAEPTDVVIDDAGNVYIIDINKKNKLLKFRVGK